MPNCLILQHVAPEPAFALAEALTRAGVEVDTRRVFDGDPVPDRPDGFDGLVVMGGPMSAASDEGFPSRATELALLAEAVRQGVPTLGVCLGAQLLAVAAGGPVYRGAAGPEVGWGPVELSPAAATDPLLAGLPDRMEVLHWHGDTFDLPSGAVHLVGNSNYANQGFRLGATAWGLQFHLEVTVAAVDGFLDAFATDAASVDGGAEAVRMATPGAIAGLAGHRDTVFDRFAGLLAVRVTGDDLAEQA
jgi:GMP synthase-like glutamine amidotransferase